MNEINAFGHIMASFDLNELSADIGKMIREIRSDLAKEYDVFPGGKNENYMGLCDIAVTRLIKQLEKYKEKRNISLVFKAEHGELSHSPICDSSHWPTQHTWCLVKRFDALIYVDPTSSQFKDIFPDIPEYYLSLEPPKWYLSDRFNRAYSGWTATLNKWKLTYKIRKDGKRMVVREGIVEFFQYSIWGGISDFIRRHFMKKG